VPIAGSLSLIATSQKLPLTAQCPTKKPHDCDPINRIQVSKEYVGPPNKSTNVVASKIVTALELGNGGKHLFGHALFGKVVSGWIEIGILRKGLVLDLSVVNV